MEFHYREKQEPSGVMNAEDAMESWLYGGDPALYLNVGSLYQQLREAAGSGYFEKEMKKRAASAEHAGTA